MTAREFNRLMSEVQAAADEHEDTLAAVYERAIRKTGRWLSEQFEALVAGGAGVGGRSYERIDTSLVAASEDWTPPIGFFEFDDEQIALDAATAAREQAARELERVMSSLVPEIAVSFDPARFTVFSETLLASLGQQAGANFTAEMTRVLGNTIRESFDKGMSVPQTAKAIRTGISGVSASTATMLARTDLISLANGGSFMAAQKVFAGTATSKRWINTHDARTRPTHVNAGDQVVPLDQPFTVGGYPLQYPGDPGGPPAEVINCRCTFVVVEGPPQSRREDLSPPLPPEPEPMPQFANTAEAGEWAQRTGLAREVDFGTLKAADARAVLEGLETIRPYTNRPLDKLEVMPSRGHALGKMKGLRPRSGDPAEGFYSIQFQRIVADQKKVEAKAEKGRQYFDAHKAREIAEKSRWANDDTRPQELRDLARSKLAKAEETERWTVWEHAEDKTKAIIAHEAAHYLYYSKAGMVERWKDALFTHDVTKWHTMSEYGATNHSEMFAEAFSAHVSGVPYPSNIRAALEEVLRAE